MREIVHQPLAEAMLTLARAVADGQQALDLASYRRLQAVLPADGAPLPPLHPVELGLLPTFYHFADTLLDLAVNVSLVREAQAPPGAPVSVTLTQVEPRFAALYGSATRRAARLSFRLLPVPEPSVDLAKIRVETE